MTFSISSNGSQEMSSAMTLMVSTISPPILWATESSAVSPVTSANRPPMAALIEGRYTGRLIDVPPGQFEICKHIKLPKYLANGDYIADLYLHQPIIQDFLRAQNCISRHIEGFYDAFATPMVLQTEGFIGLELE